MLQLPIPVLEYNVLIVNKLIRLEYGDLMHYWSMISWGMSFFIDDNLALLHVTPFKELPCSIVVAQSDCTDVAVCEFAGLFPLPYVLNDSVDGG